MSKKFKSQASSARAASVAFGLNSGFGSTFQSSSSLSYITELPDLSSISDPNLVVALRNLGKKDSTTKAKALEDLQDYVKSTKEIEDGFLDAWINLYPRTSIDNSRRVRQNSHILQGSITSLAGKKIAPYLSKAVGAWLSGAYDSDRSTSRSAQDSLEKAFPTEEKRATLWKIYKNSLLDYAEDSILVQTAKTLSDDRSTSPDDAEAKYVRVVATGLQMLGQLVKVVPEDLQSENFKDRVDILLQNKKLWEFVYHPDPTLRRGSCAILMVVIDQYYDHLDWSVLSTCFIAKGLNVSHLGSTRQFSESLLSLTKKRPQIWTSEYSSKTTVSKRILQYLKRGSEHGTEEYWKNTTILLQKLDSSVWGDRGLNLQIAVDLIEAFRSGITNPDEPRFNLQVAWSCYVGICFWITTQLPDVKDKVLSEHVLPIPEQYVFQGQKDSWSIPNSFSIKLSTSILKTMLDRGHSADFEDFWKMVITQLINSMKLSLPESSKDFANSQNKVIDISKRIFQLQSNLSSTSNSVLSIFKQSNDELGNQSIQLLKSRNGKPYCAASILDQVVHQSDFDQDAIFKSFIEVDLLPLFKSGSSERLVDVLLQSNQSVKVEVSFLMTNFDGDENCSKAFIHFLTQANVVQLKQTPGLDDFLFQIVQSHINTPAGFQILSAVFENSALKSSDIQIRLMQFLSDLLTSKESAQMGMEVLEVLSGNPKVKIYLTSDEFSGKIISNLLLLSESSDITMSEKATKLLTNLKSLNVTNGTPGQTTLNIIRDQFSGQGNQISTFSLIDLAKETFESSKNKTEVIHNLVPNSEQWENAITPHLKSSRPNSLSITSPLQGSIYIVEDEPNNTDIIRDSEDFSVLFRIVFYLTKLFSSTNIMESLDGEEVNLLSYHYPIALELINEKLSAESANLIWLNPTPEVHEEAVNILSKGNEIVQFWLESKPENFQSFQNHWIQQCPNLTGQTYKTYLLGMSFAKITSRMLDLDGPTKLLLHFESFIRNVHRSPNLIQSASLIYALREYLLNSPIGKKLINELIADVTGIKSLEMSISTARPLLLLNILLDNKQEALDGIPQQRLVFLMQNLVKLMINGNGELLSAEILKLLSSILLNVKDIYGDHWAQIFDGLVTVWNFGFNNDEDLPVIHSSLLLFRRLLNLIKDDDQNDDLIESWTSAKEELDKGLLQCLLLFNKSTSEINQPRSITADLLARLVKNVKITQEGNLFELLSSSDSSVQNASYTLLHRFIPTKQEQLSLELALENQVSHILPELFIPLSNLPDMAVNSEVMQYLYCWHLIFDHFPKASYKLQEIYLNDIKQSDTLSKFLDFVCDIIQITARSIDASKFDVQDFILGGSDSETKELQWLTIHLYYNCLNYVPSLAKSWFIEQKNRIKTPLEGWTQKYISPFIITTSLATVMDWTSQQDNDDSPIIVKSSPKGSELTASIAIDPESPPIAITINLPSSYPLDSPVVTSRTRVGVSDKNWQSWLRTIQIIIFSTGSIIEGLVAFRRNVQGALKGQTECAICYSIIGTDMQTPSKRCSTCRNMFHGSCLFRWFKSSNSSSCPLCRNNFNYA